MVREAAPRGHKEVPWGGHDEGLLTRASLPAAHALRHAGDRHERLAEERHLSALHQEQQADPVVLAGASIRVLAPLLGLGQESHRYGYQLPTGHET